MYLKKSLPFLFLVLFKISFSQSTIKGKVFDAETGDPLPFVNIIFNEKGHGFTSGLDGDFKVTTKEDIKWLKISYLGYQAKVIKISTENISKFLNIALVRTNYQIAEVVVKPGINPAHRIIIAAYQNRDRNNPEKLQSFKYTSYNKLYFTFDKLVAKRIKEVDTDTVKNIDSLAIKLNKLKQEQHLMMFETVSKRQFKYPSDNHEEIIASRVSGLKDPFIAFLATQFQSFSFYPELITLADKAYLNPISAGSTKKYLFILEDTLFTPSNDTLFVISYRPHKNRNFEGLQGQLIINSKGYAIQSVIAEPSSPSGMVSIKIQQRYERVKDSTWFPVELNTDLIIIPPNAEVKDKKTGNTLAMHMLGVGKSYLKDIEVNTEINSHDFSHVEASFDPNAGVRNNNYWNQYRKDSLTAQEIRTYKVIDSIGEKIKLDKQIRFFESLITGRIPIGFVSLNINQLFAYNRYEGYRLGLGLETNSKVSRFFKVGGYAAYGFKDEAYKYGGLAELDLNKKYEVALSYTYKNDVRESGSYSFGGEASIFSGTDSYRIFTIEKMDGKEEHRVGFGFRFLKYLKLNVSVASQKHDLLSGFYYKTKNLQDTIQKFDQSEIAATLRFAPGEKFMETPRGIMPLNTDFPVFWVNYMKGLAVMDGQFEYDKVEVRLDKSFRWRTLGKTSINIDAGKVFGNIPLSLEYFGRANYYDISVDATHSFGAMQMNEFVSDQFVSIFLKHDFGKLFWRNRTGKWQPEIAIAQNICYGDIAANPQQVLPDGYVAKTPNKGYFETGLLVNKIIPDGFMAIGFGVFYRYGKYQFSDFNDNLAYKMTLMYAF